MSRQPHARQLHLLDHLQMARSCFFLVVNILTEPLPPFTMTSLSTSLKKMNGEKSQVRTARSLEADTLGVEGVTLGVFTSLEVCDEVLSA